LKIAIHDSKLDFHPRWIEYCQQNHIAYKLVNCYANDIVLQLQDCNILLWHIHQNNPKDILVAKQILFSLQQVGMTIFPDFNTAWHFDDKLGQKYLLELLNTPLVPTFVFFDKGEALQWVQGTDFPKVFKLRGGAGSQNVLLVKSRKHARKIVQRAFNRGFRNYDAIGNLKERFRKYMLGKSSLTNVLKGIIRIVIRPHYESIRGREKGYALFQQYIPNNDSDIRIVVIDNKAFALKRLNRKNDFRASGSGEIVYSKNEIDIRCVEISLLISKNMKAQCIAYDYIFNEKDEPMLVEISFGFHADSYDDCEGFWDDKLIWHPGTFNPYGWIVDSLIRKETKKSDAH